MRQETITVDNLDQAVESILEYLEERTEENGIYFDGWQGLGASAVLRAVAERFKSAKIVPPGLKFEEIIYIDCSIWKNTRSIQRKIAEELDIASAKDSLVMQDEEDDFNGIDESSRDGTPNAARAISDSMIGKRFLLIFHNGSDNEIDVNRLGLPLSQLYKANKMLWTFRGRFRLSSKTQEIVQKADVFLSAKVQNNGTQQLWCDLVCAESEEVALYASARGVNLKAATIAKCWQYISKLNCIGSHMAHIIDYDWKVHASNYWVCDGIIGCQEWSAADTLLEEMRQDWDDPGLFYLIGDGDRWASATILFSGDHDEFLPVSNVHPTVSSFFLATQELHPERQNAFGDLKYFGLEKANYDRVSFFRDHNLFEHSENLRVLKLSRCTFSFVSPPFRLCRGLRFLGLDCCGDTEIDVAKEEGQTWTCFHGLWVLDLHKTEWILTQEMIDAMGNLREINVKGCHPRTTSLVQRWQPNLHRLRVTKTADDNMTEIGPKDASCSWTSSFLHMEKLELLDLSGHSAMQILPDLSKASNLKTVIVDGCVRLECVNADSIPESLVAFSLDAAEARTAAQAAKISLSGCSRLSSLFLRGLANLEELDLSGTAVKTLDLNAMGAPRLRRLLLLRCQRLRAILFSVDGRPRLSEVQIGTTEADADVDGSFESHVAVTDARLLRSLQLFARRAQHLLLCMSSTSSSSTTPDDSHSGEEIVASKYSDIVDRVVALQAPLPRPRPPPPRKRQGSCKVEIRSSGELDGKLASFVDIADSLYVHDGSWSSCIPGSNWGWVKWCTVERCPRLVSVFDLGDDHQMVFCWLETFWASDLQSARFIWGSRSTSAMNSFGLLQHIHLHSCPNLIHVLPLSSNLHLPRLEKMEILHCESLRHVFPLGVGGGGGALDFPQLRYIHLHELPRLQGICEGRLLRAAKLEAVEIKGCWSLRQLPAVARGRRCALDCDKEWWESLQWDAQEDGHHASLYEPRYSRYYKRALPRGSLLR